MKRIIVFIPAIALVLFVLKFFVLREKEAGKKAFEATKNIVFKSADSGQTWQDVSEGLLETKSYLKTPAWQRQVNVVEFEGVLIATGQKGIKRSTDNGKHWQWVISEGGIGIAVERIKGGFTAITYNATTKSRRIRMSLDNGKTWQAIDEGLPPSMLISSIKQMGKYLICAHPAGIYRSSDMGKTWNRVLCGVRPDEFEVLQKWNNLPSQPKNVFKLYTAGNVLYAVARPSGC